MIIRDSMDKSAPVNAKKALEDFKRKAAARASKKDLKGLKVGKKLGEPSKPAKELSELEEKNEARLKKLKIKGRSKTFPQDNDIPLALVSQKTVDTFTPEKKEKILASILLGLHPMKAAILNGITNHTFNNWKERARCGDSAFMDFFFEVDRAVVQWEAIHLKRIHDAGKDDWRASTWSLERIAPQSYMPGARLEVTGAGGGALEISHKIAVGAVIDKYADLLNPDGEIIDVDVEEVGE